MNREMKFNAGNVVRSGKKTYLLKSFSVILFFVWQLLADY